MIGPIPTGTRFGTIAGITKCYGTPTYFVKPPKIGYKGFRQGAKLGGISFTRPNYGGAPLPYSTDQFVKITSRGPFYAQIIKRPMRGLADNLFAAMDMTGTMSGAHNVTAMIGRADTIFSATNGNSVLYISPIIKGAASDLFGDTTGTSILFQRVALISVADTIGNFANGSNSVLAQLQYMQGNAYSAADIGTTSSSYLFTYNLTVGPLKSAISLAW